MTLSTAGRHRWWPRFTLRAALALTGIAALILGAKAEQVRGQRDAVRELQELGVECTYDWQRPVNGHLYYEVGGGRPSKLSEYIGADWVHHVLWVDIVGGSQGINVAALSKLPYLEILTICERPDLDDNTLALMIRNHPRLIGVHIWSCKQITTKGLSPLLSLNMLKQVTIDAPDPGGPFAARLEAKGVKVHYPGCFFH